VLWIFLQASWTADIGSGGGGIGAVSIGINELMLAIPVAPPIVLFLGWLVVARDDDKEAAAMKFIIALLAILISARGTARRCFILRVAVETRAAEATITLAQAVEADRLPRPDRMPRPLARCRRSAASPPR